ncbi:Ribonuclease H [Neorhizobium galegae bv. officinalis bv. officinalis str. HAMBI 1141]|uniref:Ribonuclease H n=1 Tax=Neorhizobium galegae bv. officinalis bv. officinalis str. HAMBI 1141 TaxID=1028801 RepID=A0A068TDM9_NEOGA|nr:ribonuclease H [Neorhizobium galegae]CDN56523.1 Ribonuclease H [Neorhizobium galegae bv. officinalis bv. officinalis str. HAMBI 1141]
MTDSNLPSMAMIMAGRHYAIFSDGACPGNPGRGGWGVLLQLREGERVIKQAAFAGYQRPNTTNIRMEMTAALMGISRLTKEPETAALVVMDNKMIVDAMTLGGFHKWKAAGWLKGTKPLPNGDLWEKIDNAIGKRLVHWQWVRGHVGHTQNEIANMLATNAAAGLYLSEGRSVRQMHGDLFF